MHKLTLAMDDLRVESFDTTSAPKEKGTVLGEQFTYAGSCYDPTCAGFNTCTCGESCPDTCSLSCDSCRPRYCTSACPIDP